MVFLVKPMGIEREDVIKTNGYVALRDKTDMRRIVDVVPAKKQLRSFFLGFQECA